MWLLTAAVQTAAYRTNSMWQIQQQCNVLNYCSCTNSSLQNRQHVTDTATVQCAYLLQLYEQQLTGQTACDRYRNSAMCLLTTDLRTAAYRTDSMWQIQEQCNVPTYYRSTNSSLQNRQHVTDTGTVQCAYLLQLYEQQLTGQTACDRYRNSAMCLLTAALWTPAPYTVIVMNLCSGFISWQFADLQHS